MWFKLLNDEKSYLKVLKENKSFVKEAGKVKIPVEHPGVLEVPEGKNVEDLPYSHFAALAKKKGFGEISKALTNLHTWNKDRDPKLSGWADKMQQRLHDEFSKEAASEAVKVSDLDSLIEKWAKDVNIKSTGEHAGKSVEQLKKEIEALRGKPGNKEKMGELIFALRAKQGWKKSAGLPKNEQDMIGPMHSTGEDEDEEEEE